MTVGTIKARDTDALGEQAWSMLDQAMTSMSMTLDDGTTIRLTPDAIVKIVQWLAQIKTKKPKVVSTPEDFILSKTASEDTDG